MRQKMRFEKIQAARHGGAAALCVLLTVGLIFCAFAKEQRSLAAMEKENTAAYGLFAYWPPEARAEYSEAAASEGKTCEDGKRYVMPGAADLTYHDALRAAYKEIGLDWDDCQIMSDPFFSGGGIVENGGGREWHITLTPVVNTAKDCTCYFVLDASAGRILTANYPANAAKTAQKALEDFNALYAERSSAFEELYGTEWWRWPLTEKAAFSKLAEELGWNGKGIIGSYLTFAVPDETDLTEAEALAAAEKELQKHFTVSGGKILLSDSAETLTYAAGLSFSVQSDDSTVREYTVEFYACYDSDETDEYNIFLGAVFIASPSGEVCHQELNDEDTLVSYTKVETESQAEQLYQQYRDDAYALYKAYVALAGTPDQWTDEMQTCFYLSSLSESAGPVQLEADPSDAEYAEICGMAENYMMSRVGVHHDANGEAVLTVLRTVTLWQLGENFQYYKIEYVAQTEGGSMSAVIDRLYILRPDLCAFGYEWLYGNFSGQMVEKRDAGKLNEAQFAQLQYLLEYGDFFLWPPEIKASYTSFCKQYGALPEDGLEYVMPTEAYDESLFVDAIESACNTSGLEAYFDIGCGLVKTDEGNVWHIRLRPASETAENAECTFELDEMTYAVLRYDLPDGALERAREAWKADITDADASAWQLLSAFNTLYGDYWNWPLEARALYAERTNAAVDFPDSAVDVMPEEDDMTQDEARAIADQAFSEFFGEAPDALTVAGAEVGCRVMVQTAFQEMPKDPDTRFYQFTYIAACEDESQMQIWLGAVEIASPSGTVRSNSLSAEDKTAFERRIKAKTGYLQTEQEKGLWCYWDYADLKAYGDYVGLSTEAMRENAPENELQRDAAVRLAREYILENVEYVYPQAYYGVKEPEKLIRERVDALKTCAVYYAGSEETASFWMLLLFEDEWVAAGLLDTFQFEIDAETGTIMTVVEPGGNG